MKKYILLLVVFLIYSCDKELSVSEPENLMINECKIYIVSKPEKARIYLDSLFTGKYTPDTLKWVSEGKHIITLKQENMNDLQTEIYAFKDTTVSAFFDFTKFQENYGRILVYSDPEKAFVKVLGTELSGYTKILFDNLLAGDYTLECSAPSHITERKTVHLKPSKYAHVVEFNLIDTSLFVPYTNLLDSTPVNIIKSVSVIGNEVWVGTLNYGLIILENNKVKKVYNVDNSILKTNAVSGIYNFDDIIWITTSYGLIKIEGNNWELYDNTNTPMISTYVFDIVKDHNGVYWFGTQTGLLKFENNQWTNIRPQNNILKFSNITSLALDKNNTLWIGNSNLGIGIYNNGDISYFDRKANNFPGQAVNKVFVDKNNNVWVCFSYSFYKGYEGGTVIYNSENGWTNLSAQKITRITDVIEDENYLWLVNYNGIYLFENQNLIKHYLSNIHKNRNGLLSNRINDISLDKNNNMWIATELGGLTKFMKWKETQ